MKSEINSKRKIPDIMYFDIEKREAVVLEIKPSSYLSNLTLCEYANNKFRLPENMGEFITGRFQLRYEFWANCSVKLKKHIINVIGKDEYEKLVAEYRSQEKTYTGFPGKLNPMYGRKHTKETKKLISDKYAERGGHAGAKNGMYGKTHTPEAILRCTAKWKDPAKKFAMMKKGMLSHISKFTNDEFVEYMIYANTILSGRSHKRPAFINRAYTVNEKNVMVWFGDIETFFKECKNVK